MRDYNFRFVGLRFRQYGGGPVVLPSIFSVGTGTFTASRAGRWKFVAWGSGQGGDGGRSSSYGEVTKQLALGANVAIVVGGPNSGLPVAGDTRLTFPDSSVAVAQGAPNHGVPVATGFDVALGGSAGGSGGGNGSPGLGTGGGAGGTGDGSNNGGAGAPANLPLRGGRGANGDGTLIGSTTPGAGGSLTVSAGGGMVLVAFVGD